MDKATELMRNILHKCDIRLEGELISKEVLLQVYAEYILQTMDKKKHNVGFVLHTGSICFDVISIIYAVASCLVYNEAKSDKMYWHLENGDRVTYEFRGVQKEFIFNGEEEISGIRYRKLKDVVPKTGGKGRKTISRDITFVPESRWSEIFPVEDFLLRDEFNKRSPKVSWFYRVIMEKECNEPRVDKSVVVVMPHKRADFLVNKISIECNGHQIRLFDLVKASYFTVHKEYVYGGACSKGEANIKFTERISVARDLILSRDGNRQIGLIVAGNNIIKRNLTELPELLHRRSLQYVYVLMTLDYGLATDIISGYDEANLFVCTKEFLTPFFPKNYYYEKCLYGKYCRELWDQVDTIIQKEITPYVIPSVVQWEDYKNVKLLLRAIKYTDYIAQGKEEFLIQAYGIIKLFLTAVFKISDLEECIWKNRINIISPQKRIEDLKVLANNFPEDVKTLAMSVIDFIKCLHLELEKNTAKEKYLKDAIQRNSNKKIAVIVPKAYYEDVLRGIGLYGLMEAKENLTIVTANKFDNTVLYDHIFVVGNFEGNSFDVFRCQSSKFIETLLYEFELRIFKHRLWQYKKKEKELDKHIFNTGYISNKYVDDIELSVTDNSEVVEIENIEKDVDEYISRLNELTTFKSINASTTSSTSVISEVVAIANFDNGEKALFTKHYKAYVFDDEEGIVKEKEVTDLCEGDCIVFTQRNSERRDIVDDILDKLIQRKKLDQGVVESYYKSKKWKEILVSYMQTKRLSASNIAKMMIANGVQVQENTVKGWLDEDSHTIGPRKVDSIQQIANLVGDRDLFTNAEQYYEACSIVRRVRREILKQIGEAIISKLCGQKVKGNSIIADVYERIDSIALILCLESITAIKREVPVNLTNRPMLL